MPAPPKPTPGAQRLGARHRRRPPGGACPHAPGDRPRRQRLRRGARPGRPHRAAAVDRAARRPLRARGRGAGTRAGAAARVCAVPGVRALSRHRPLPAVHRPAAVAGAGFAGRGVPLVWPARSGAALRALRLGCGARRRGRRPAHRRRAGPGVPGHGDHHLGGRRHCLRGRGRSGSGRRHSGSRAARLGRLRRGAAAGQLGAAGPPRPARGRGRAVAVDGRGRAGARPRPTAG